MSSSNEIQQKAPASSHCFNSNWGNATLVQARWLPRFKCLLSNLGTVPALASINSDEETSPLQAKSPEEICRLFQRYMAEGDVESLLSIYDSEAVVLTQSGRGKKGPGFEGAVGQCSCREASVRFQYQASDPVRRYRAHAH